MEILTQIFGLVLSLSILVILHETGHFIFARLFNTRVEKFYLFFNPWFSLFKFKKGETEYGLGWLPLGGYVKIAGMIDESLDREQMKKPPQPWEFRSKPAWQRLLIMLGGVLVNFLLALAIYSMILYKWGEQYLPADEVKYGYDFHPVAEEIGFQDGDIITLINQKPVDNYTRILPSLIMDEVHTVTVIREGREVSVYVPDDFSKRIIREEVKNLLTLNVPFVVDSIIPGHVAVEAGFMKSDSVVAINGTPTPFYHQFEEIKQQNKGKEVEVTVIRKDQPVNLSFRLPESGSIGIGNRPMSHFFNLNEIKYGFFESIPAGIRLGMETLVFYVKQLRLVFSPEGARQLGGFGTIGSLFPKQWNWYQFWNMTAFLSVILAFMNILPIPALDGGHVMFLTYEIITGRKPGDKFLEIAQIAGLIILLGLIIFANANDIIRWLGK
ncbi:MAG TPA: RIP metalloprotease RseP [Bacteroidetes bacterium]|nr:RIP metalloprotease RseP [Bacteroidota bacterium]